MMRIVLCQNDAVSRAGCMQSQVLPDNYMGDYSQMGFIVDRYDATVLLLKSSGYLLVENDGYTEVIVESHRQLPIIQKILAAENMYCEYSDIADTLYQA